MEDLKVNIVFSNETLECLAKLAKKENQPIQDLAEKLMQAVVTHELSELGNLITFSHETSVWLMGIARLKNQPVQDLTEKLMQEAIEAYEDIAQQQSNVFYKHYIYFYTVIFVIEKFRKAFSKESDAELQDKRC